MNRRTGDTQEQEPAVTAYQQRAKQNHPVGWPSKKQADTEAARQCLFADSLQCMEPAIAKGK